MRYAPVSRLGRGGTGVVDLATDEAGGPVALKRVPLHGSPEEADAARRRIRREADVLRSLDHPAIVRLLDVVDDGDDVLLVMPYLAGGTLAARVAERGPLPAEEVAALAATLLGALAAAHRQGVVHRDIKPANVLYDAEGRPHLADFGAATSRDATVGLTGSGLVVGTPAFMAPEQARGAPAGPPADVFALGATLRHALTGAGPWGADGAVAFHRAAAGRVERLPRGVAPRPLARLLDAMCDPSPQRRPTAAALAGSAGGTMVAAPPSSRMGGLRRRHRLRHRGAWLGAGAVLALGTAGALALGAPDRWVGAGTGEGVATATTLAPCADLPYRPCGGPVAPGTDGHACIEGRGDYDGDPANGCEAVPDDRDGSVLTDELTANLVPVDDVDRYPLPVRDRAQLLCDGSVEVTLTAPAGVAQRLEVLDGDEVVRRAGSTDGTPAAVRLREPGCFSDDSTELEVRVSSIGADRSAEPYLLEVVGSY
jgi:hypothetical protein